MDLFDEKITERAKSEDVKLPGDFSAKLSKELESLPTGRRVNVARGLRFAAIIAAALAALTVTAFATGFVKFNVDSTGRVQLGRFALGYVVDEQGRNRFGYQVIDNPDRPINPERILVDSEGTTVIAPVDVDGVEIVVEDGRFMLYYQNGIIEGSKDITEELRANHGYHCSESAGGYSISVTVYTTGDPDDGTPFEGNYYRVKYEGHISGNTSGVHNFSGDGAHKVSGNCYIEHEPIVD